MEQTPMGPKRLTPERVANRVLWVKALLSGNYRQGRGRLRNKEAPEYNADGFEMIYVGDNYVPNKTFVGHCCLGVAAECFESGKAFLDKYPSKGFLITDWAASMLGLTSGTSRFSDQYIASFWNDTKHFSFDEIADRIALATERLQRFDNVTNPLELSGREPGEYAREWVARMESDV